jgi:hypothetical protein
MKTTIHAKGTEIAVVSRGKDDDFISLTDIAKYKNPEFPADVVKNWLRTRSTIEFLGIWEEINNPSFKLVEFDQFRNEAGSNTFVLNPQKWVEKTNAIGIVSKSGRYGGTFAHKDIAFEFASWISAEFKLYIIKDYQRLKSDETSQAKLEWNVSQAISKINYKIHTDAIQATLVPKLVSSSQKSLVYANEADMLNIALFGMTAKQWKDANPGSKGNLRDSATLQQLIVLSNLESMNAELIKVGQSQQERLVTLNKMAIGQMKALVGNAGVNRLEGE